MAGTSIAPRAGKPYADLALTFSCPGPTGSFHLLYKVFQDSDAVDHDGPGSRSAVSGFPPVTSGGPATQTPNANRWIAQSGTSPDNETYGLIYSAASGPFVGYSQSNFTMSKFKLDIPTGGSHTITRKLVVTSSGGAADKFAVLNQFPTG